MKTSGCYFNPLNKGFKNATQDFSKLQSWWKKALAITAFIAGGILTPYLLFTGSFAAFRRVVEWLKPGDNKQADNVSNTTKKFFNQNSDPSTDLEGSSEEDFTTSDPLDRTKKIVLSSDQFSIKRRANEDLQANTYVKGNVYLHSIDDLTLLPKGLHVDGELDIWGCPGSSLAEGLHVNGDLSIRECDDLTSLPKGLRVNGNLKIRKCKNLTSLPEGLIVKGNLLIDECTNLTFVPKNIRVCGGMHLRNCENLVSLPKGFRIEGNLHIGPTCFKMTSLPENLHVGKNLNLIEFTDLTFLPKGLYVGKNLDLNCSNTGICYEIDGFDAPITNYKNLPSLPENLHVGKNLILTLHTNLTSLPESLQVDGNLDLSYCTGLSFLPNHFKLGGDLDLSGCSNLTSLPDSITSLGYRDDGEIRMINLSGTGLSEDILNRLRDSDHEGIQFHYSQRTLPGELEFSNIKEAFDFWIKEAGEDDMSNTTASTEGFSLKKIGNSFLNYFNSETVSPNAEFTDLESKNICDFLSYLTSTKEFKNKQTKEFLAKRVVAIINLLSKEGPIRERVYYLICGATETCGDRVISALDDIEQAIQIDEIENNNYSKKELKEIAKGYFFLEMVDKKAKEHVASLSFVDEVEVYLAFRIGLADRFKLPFKTRNMIYRSCADVTDEKIELMGNEIEKNYTKEKLKNFLKTWSPWIKFQRKQSIPSYETLEPDTENKVEKNTICPITQEAPENPVSYNKTIYNYDDFIKHYNTNGNDPMNTREKIDLKKLKRVISSLEKK